MSSQFSLLKKDSKIQNKRFNSAKISGKLTSKMSSISGRRLLAFSNMTGSRNKKKVLITNVLSVSKHLIINADNPESTKDIVENIRYEYPYKPDFFLKLENNSNGKKIFPDKINLLTMNKKPFSLSSFESSVSTYKSSTQNSVKKNFFFNPNYLNSSSNKKTKLTLMSHKTEPMKINKKTDLKNYTTYNTNITELITNDNINLTGENFMKFVDNINADKNYINQYKQELNDYFDNNKLNKSDTVFLKNIINNHKYPEKEALNENESNNYFFTSNYYSSKKKEISIKNSNIILKISSLKIIFYEVKENKKNYNCINYLNNSDNSNNFINTKIKFPFEFLAMFYGLNFEEFINILIALIEYDFNTNKFYIDYNTFINKIEEAKILYDFYTSKSFAFVYNNNNIKEYFLFDWDVKGKNNEIKKFRIKILLPQIKMKIKCDNKFNIKFYSNINITTMYHLIKNSFNKWDFFIFVNFSQHKLFRYEINRIICRKYLNPNYYQYKSGQNVLYNLTNSITKINTIKKNYLSFSFFYSYIKEEKFETNFINFKLPKISIKFHSFSKNFSLDSRKIFQLNKLRKYFLPEDLIKYSMKIETMKKRIKKQESEKQQLKKILAAKTMKPSMHRENSRISIDLKAKKGNVKKFFKKKIKQQKEMLIINPSVNNEYNEIIKDINLDLDKYIFNFDESILKFINIDDVHKNDIPKHSRNYNNNNDIYGDNTFPVNEKKLNIDIDTLELSWTNRDGLTNNYKFDKNTSQYLLDFSQNKWKIYVEKDIDKIISGISNVQRSKTKKTISFFPKNKINF